MIERAIGSRSFGGRRAKHRFAGYLDPTALDSEHRLLADFLYVVYFIGKRDPKLCTIPRDAINPEFVAPKAGFRISARFKKESALKPFIKYP